MKNILCFGDSNTWGYNPKNGSRWNWEERWTGILQKKINSLGVNDEKKFRSVNPELCASIHRRYVASRFGQTSFPFEFFRCKMKRLLYFSESLFLLR